MQTAGSGPDWPSTAVFATLPVTASGHRGNLGAMQTAGSGPDLMSTAVIATLPVTASGHLGNLR